jgi:hypothetical protein
MSPYQRKQKEKKRKNLFRKWHRRVGFTAALFLLNLAVTGILLNHSEYFNLDKTYIESQWLVNWYGVKAPQSAKCVQTEDAKTSLCQIGNLVFRDNRFLVEETFPLVGLIDLNDLLYLVTTHSILIYTPDLELVERVDHNTSLPVPIEAVWLNKGEQALLLSSNQQTWAMDESELSFVLVDAEPPAISAGFISESNQLIGLQKSYLARQITELKFVQDLHSGRILSLPGKLLNDLAAIVIILLVISGFVAWQRRKQKYD